jgi:YVTN family beta-propeller protein
VRLLRTLLLLVVLVAPSAAAAADGAVDLYLQPLPAEAATLDLRVAAAWAIAVDGSRHALDVRLTTVSAATASRQRLLASGRLPAGSYTGFALQVDAVGSPRQAGPAPPPDGAAPIVVDTTFAVVGQQASLFWILVAPAAAAGSPGIPATFSAVVPGKPLAGRAAFVTNAGANTITVVDKQLAQAVALIETCGGPAGMALDQRAARLYVACERDDEVHAIDVVSARVVERARLGPGDRPRELALTPDGRTLVSVNTGSNSVAFLETAPLSRGERVDVDSGPAAVAIDPAGRRAFVFNTLASSVSVIDLARRAVAATLSTESSPLRGRFGGNGDRLFVVHERSPYVTVVDPRQLTIVGRERLRARVGALAVDARRNLVYVGDRDDPVVEFYDPNTLLPLDVMKAGGVVSHLAIDAEQNSLYMVSTEAARLAIASLAERKVVSTVDVGPGAYWVAVMGEK